MEKKHSFHWAYFPIIFLYAYKNNYKRCNMTLWKVTEGRFGEAEQIALEKDLIVILWNELPDLSKIQTRDELKELYSEHYSNEKKWLLQI